MTFNWQNVPALSARSKAYSAAKKVITPQTYGFNDGEWNVTDAIHSTDERKFLLYQILDGVDASCKRKPEITPLPMAFRLKVLTRQACVRTAGGKRIHPSAACFEDNGMGGDVLPEFGELPKAGDVVEWKAHPITYDDENDRRVSSKVIQEWSRRGKRPHTYVEFVVDKDGCIAVLYPFVLEMLTKKGRQIAFPRFAKMPKGKHDDKRKMVNWWFEEVAQDFTAAKKRKRTAPKQTVELEPITTEQA